MGELIRWRRPRPIFIGRWDFARWWVIAVFDKPLVKLPVPRGRRLRWRYKCRLDFCRWSWPWISLETSEHGWWLYILGFTWEYSAAEDAG